MISSGRQSIDEIKQKALSRGISKLAEKNFGTFTHYLTFFNLY